MNETHINSTIQQQSLLTPQQVSSSHPQHVGRDPPQQPKDRVVSVPRMGRRRAYTRRGAQANRGRRGRQAARPSLHGTVRPAESQVRAVSRAALGEGEWQASLLIRGVSPSKEKAARWCSSSREIKDGALGSSRKISCSVFGSMDKSH